MTDNRGIKIWRLSMFTFFLAGTPVLMYVIFPVAQRFYNGTATAGDFFNVMCTAIAYPVSVVSLGIFGKATSGMMKLIKS